MLFALNSMKICNIQVAVQNCHKFMAPAQSQLYKLSCQLKMLKICLKCNNGELQGGEEHGGEQLSSGSVEGIFTVMGESWSRFHRTDTLTLCFTL